MCRGHYVTVADLRNISVNILPQIDDVVKSKESCKSKMQNLSRHQKHSKTARIWKTSRSAVRKWVRRFQAEGEERLKERCCHYVAVFPLAPRIFQIVATNWRGLKGLATNSTHQQPRHPRR